jgi:hypothetical protein
MKQFKRSKTITANSKLKHLFYLDPNSIPSKKRPKKNEIKDLLVTSALAGLFTSVFDRVSVYLEN